MSSFESYHLPDTLIVDMPNSMTAKLIQDSPLEVTTVLNGISPLEISAELHNGTMSFGEWSAAILVPLLSVAIAWVVVWWTNKKAQADMKETIDSGHANFLDGLEQQKQIEYEKNDVQVRKEWIADVTKHIAIVWNAIIVVHRYAFHKHNGGQVDRAELFGAWDDFNTSLATLYCLLDMQRESHKGIYEGFKGIQKALIAEVDNAQKFIVGNIMSPEFLNLIQEVIKTEREKVFLKSSPPVDTNP